MRAEDIGKIRDQIRSLRTQAKDMVNDNPALSLSLLNSADCLSVVLPLGDVNVEDMKRALGHGEDVNGGLKARNEA